MLTKKSRKSIFEFTQINKKKELTKNNFIKKNKSLNLQSYTEIDN